MFATLFASVAGICRHLDVVVLRARVLEGAPLGDDRQLALYLADRQLTNSERLTHDPLLAVESIATEVDVGGSDVNELGVPRKDIGAHAEHSSGIINNGVQLSMRLVGVRLEVHDRLAVDALYRAPRVAVCT
jgi:hypothetical protein